MPLLPVVPELVSDTTLKRARTTITEGGEEKEAIRVTSVGGNGNLDSQGVADAMGKSASNMASTSVLGYLANNTQANVAINTYLSDISSTAGSQTTSAWSGTGDGSLNAVAKRTSNDTHAAAEVLGTTTDQSASDTQNGSINARLRNISAEALNLNTNLITKVGDPYDTPWDGGNNSDATLNAIAKRTSNDTTSIKSSAASIYTKTNNINNGVGTKSDAAWSGSGDGTVIALLKGIYNKL